MEEEPTEVPTLDALVEIRDPAPVSNAPATTAWAVVFVVAGLLLLTVGLLLWRRWRENAYRRAALRHLDRIARTGALSELPVLVKRVALEVWPREQVAALSGEAWLTFLDASYGGSGFTVGPGRRLPDLAYGGATLPRDSEPELVALVRNWIHSHRAKQRA